MCSTLFKEHFVIASGRGGGGKDGEHNIQLVDWVLEQDVSGNEIQWLCERLLVVFVVIIAVICCVCCCEIL